MSPITPRSVGLACFALLLSSLQMGNGWAQTGNEAKSSKKQDQSTASAASSDADKQSKGPSSSGKSSQSTSSKDGVVSYADLKSKSVSVPYGSAFTIKGDISDVQLSGGTLGSLLAVQTVSGEYTSSDGTKGSIPSSAVSGTSWTATIGKLAADTSVTISFQFTGTPAISVQEAAISEMFADPAYQAGVSQFVKAAQGKASAAQVSSASLLAGAATDVLVSVLTRKGLTPKSTADLKSSLVTALSANMGPVFNLGEECEELQRDNNVASVLGLDVKDLTSLTVLLLYDRLTDASKPLDFGQLDPTDVPQYAKQFDTFKRTYQNAMAGLKASLASAAFSGTSSLAIGNDQESAVVSDLKKYAGFDVGALYAYRLNELRSFAMVHIYFGPIQLKTDAPPGQPGRWEWMRQRVSLTFGIALKDISGSSKSKIASENAFVYGLGFRLNKYFRLSAGGMMYRATLPTVNGSSSPSNGTLRHEFFVGPSIDVTALPALQTIFAKSKSI